MSDAPELVSPTALFATLADDPGAYTDAMARYRDYRHVFLGSEEGRRVLHDLLRACRVNCVSVPMAHPIDPMRVAFNDGMRNVGLAVMGTITKEPVGNQPAMTKRKRED